MKTLLKKYYLFRAAIYSLLLLSLNINAHYLPGDWQPAPQLGSAYSSNKHKIFAAKCVNADKTEVGQAVGDLKYSTQATLEKIASAFSGSLEAKMSVPFNKASASMSYAQENAATDQRINWFFEFHATPKSISLELDNLDLSPFGKKMLNNQSKLPNICGDEFVYQIDLGAKLIATMSIEFASKEDKSAFQSAVSVDVNWGIGSASASGSLNTMQQRMGSRTTVKIEVHQTGGNPSKLAGILNDKVVDCNLSNMQACLDTFGQVIKYANKDFRDQLSKIENFSVVRYHTMPYKESMAFELVPDNGFPMLNNLVKLKREQIQEKYEKQSIAYSRAHYIKAKLGNFIEKEQLLKIEEIYKNSFANMTKLTEAMNVCLEHSADDCINFSEDLLSYDLSDLEVKVSAEIDPKSGLGKLFKTVKDNNISDAHTIIKENGAQLISKNDPRGYSPFHRAIEHAHHEMVDFLLQENKDLANIACDDDKGYTPLCLAAKGGTHNHILCMNLLCVAGDDIDCKTKSGLTPLQVAVMHGQLQTAKELIRRGANKQILDKHGSTLLHLAAEVGDVALINYLIDDAKLAVNAQDKKGLTPLCKAARGGKINAVENLLLKGSDPKILDNQEETALHWGIKHEAVVKKLLNSYELPITLRSLIGHNKSVDSICFSPDGTMIASGSYKTIKLWDTNTGDLIHTIEGHTSHVKSLSFSPDSSIIASGSCDKTIKLWDTNTGTLIRTIEGHTSSVESIYFSPDCATLVSGSDDKNIKLWNTNTGYIICTLEGHTRSVKSVSFNHDSSMIVSGSSDKTIKLWNSTNGTLMHTFGGHNLPVKIVSFSPDSSMIASTNYYKTIKLLNPTTGGLMRTLEGHVDIVESICFSPDGVMIASGGRDNTIKLWNSTSGALMHTLEDHNKAVNSVSFSPNGSILACGSSDTTIKLWNLCFDSILHQAIRGKNSKVVKMIIEKFPLLPFIRTPQGELPLDLAKQLQNSHDDGTVIVELLNKHQ